MVQGSVHDSMCENPWVTAQRVPLRNLAHVWSVGMVHTPTFLVSASQTKCASPWGYDRILQKWSRQTQGEPGTHISSTSGQTFTRCSQSLRYYPDFICMQPFECHTAPKEGQWITPHSPRWGSKRTGCAPHLWSKGRCTHHSSMTLVCHRPPD